MTIIYVDTMTVKKYLSQKQAQKTGLIWLVG